MHFGRRPHRLLRLLPLVALVAIIAVACDDPAGVDAPQTTFKPQSDFTDSVQDVYVLVTWLAAIVFVLVLAATLVLSLWFRERPGRVAKQLHGNTRLEIVWTLIPVVILAAIAVPTWDVIVERDADPPPDALEIEVIGHQWWFEFRYPEFGLVTANEMHIPENRAVSLTFTSVDVIHSFWVPQLVGKTDLVPGHENHSWFTPNPGSAREDAYLGQCAEFCGLSHANMRFRTFVDTPADFAAWVENETADAPVPEEGSLAAQGAQIIAENGVFAGPDGEVVLGCASCHVIQGTNATGTVGPNLTHFGSRSTIAAGTLDNTTRDLRDWISDPSEIKPGVVPPSSMPAFGDVLTTEQLDAIVAYLQSLQ